MLYLQNKQIIHSHFHFSQSYILPITRLTPLAEIYKQMGIGDGCCFSYSGTGILQSLWGFPEGKKECFLSLGPFISLLLSELTIQQCLTREGPLGALPKAEWEEVRAKFCVIHGGPSPLLALRQRWAPRVCLDGGSAARGSSPLSSKAARG